MKDKMPAKKQMKQIMKPKSVKVKVAQGGKKGMTPAKARTKKC